MTTRQMYSGKGDSTTQPIENSSTLEQTAKNQTQLPHLSDHRQEVIHDYQSDLLNCVSDFVALGGASYPVEAINDLLYAWLTRPEMDTKMAAVQSQLHIVLQTILFLTKLNEYQDRLDRFIEKGGESC